MEKLAEPVFMGTDLTFEEAMQQIEQLVRKMENNTLPLSETLSAFEQGIALTLARWGAILAI